jgi:hypothetical protein
MLWLPFVMEPSVKMAQPRYERHWLWVKQIERDKPVASLVLSALAAVEVTLTGLTGMEARAGGVVA